MIKNLLSFSAASLFAVFATTAQSVIPNADFESWSGQNATSWNNLNGVATGSCTKVTASGDYHGGTAAMLLTTKTAFFNTVPGTAATATINLLEASITGGIDFTDRPDSLTGWYKYIPVGADAGNIVGILFNATRDTIATAVFFPAGTVSTYTFFKAAFEYRIPDAVDTAVFILASSGPTGGQVNTKMYIDDLNLVYDNTVGVDNVPTMERIGVYPNPASENIHVDMAGIQNASISIFDVTGKKVADYELESRVTRINVSTLAKGLYVYQLNNQNNGVIKTSKFIVK